MKGVIAAPDQKMIASCRAQKINVTCVLKLPRRAELRSYTIPH